MDVDEPVIDEAEFRISFVTLTPTKQRGRRREPKHSHISRTMATHQPATAVPTPPTMLQDKLLEHDKSELEEGRDGIPQDIWDDIQKNEQFIYYSLMFLNGSVMWAYYSCLSAQDFYAAKFEGSGVDFRFLTTMILSWPMVVGHFIQMLFALDKKYDQKRRVTLGFLMFMAMALCIMAVSTVNWDTKKSKATGAWLILACFAVIGASNVLAEATFYMLAALFPFDKFTHGVQIGNVSAGIINITVSTIKA
ncbi:TPA: hypothetical protein N0F65_009241, partial [Lagenidium giganteum]